MQVPASMLLVATLVVAAGAAIITPANAADTRLSDVAYMKAARCAGLAQGLNRDTRHVDALLDSEGNRHPVGILEESEELRASAAQEARRAPNPASSPKLTAEIDGCQAYLGAPQPGAMTASAH